MLLQDLSDVPVAKRLNSIFLLSELEFNLILQHFVEPLGLRFASKQKFAYNKKIMLSELFYAKRLNSIFFYCKLEFTLILQHFAEAQGPQV